MHQVSDAEHILLPSVIDSGFLPLTITSIDLVFGNAQDMPLLLNQKQ
jgi:hypothetical protein